MKRLIPLLLISGWCVAEPLKTVFNPFTGKQDYITKMDSNTVLGTGPCTSTSNSNGTVSITCSGGSGPNGAINTASQYSAGYYSVTGSSNVISGVSPVAGTSVLTSSGTAGPPYWAPASGGGANPAGSATELQARLNGTTFAAVVGSSSTATGPVISSGTISKFNTHAISGDGSLYFGASPITYDFTDTRSGANVTFQSGSQQIQIGDNGNGFINICGTDQNPNYYCSGFTAGSLGYSAHTVSWVLPDNDSAGFWKSNGSARLSIAPLSSADMSALLASTNVWTGGNTFQSSSTFTGTINISSNVLLSGSAGSSGQFLQSQGAGAVPTWGTAAGGGTGSIVNNGNPNNVPYYSVVSSNTLSAYTGMGLNTSSVTITGGSLFNTYGVKSATLTVTSTSTLAYTAVQNNTSAPGGQVVALIGTDVNTPSASSVDYVYGTVGVADQTGYGSGSADDSAGIWGVGNYLGHTSAQSIEGGEFSATNGSTGTVAYQRGVFAESYAYNTGIITNNYGVESWEYAIHGSTITNNYGFYARNPLTVYVTTGIITNNYGLYLEPQLNGGTNYGIYSVGNNDVFTGTMTVSSFTGAGLASCTGASNALTWNSSTYQFGCNTISGGGGGSSTLAVQQNGVNITSPTVAINFLSPPFGVALVNGSTSQVTLNGSSVTLQGPIVSSITLSAMYGAPTLTGTNFTALPGAQVGSGVPAANIAAGSLGALVLASSFPVSGATAGSYTNSNITINAQGIVTLAANGSAGGGVTVPSTFTWTGVIASSIQVSSLTINTVPYTWTQGVGAGGVFAVSTSSGVTVTNTPTLTGTNITSIPAASINAGSLGGSVIASSITLASMYGAPTLTGTNFTSLPGAQVGSGVPAANIAAGTLGSNVVSSITLTGDVTGSGNSPLAVTAAATQANIAIMSHAVTHTSSVTITGAGGLGVTYGISAATITISGQGLLANTTFYSTTASSTAVVVMSTNNLVAFAVSNSSVTAGDFLLSISSVPGVAGGSANSPSFFGVNTYGHIISSGTAPTPSSCGTGSPAVAGTDEAGVITLGGGSPTACTITFANAYINTPVCVCSPNAGVSCGVTTASNSAVTFTLSVTETGINYICIGNKG